MRACFLVPFALAALGCTVTTYQVDVDDPAVIRVVPLPDGGVLDTTSAGERVLRTSEARVISIVDARGHVAPRGNAYEIEFPIGQVALPRCAHWWHRQGCAPGQSFEIVAPLDHVREVRRVTRYERFLGGWLAFSGSLVSVGAAAEFTGTGGDPGWRIAGGTALAVVSAAAITLGAYLLFAPARTTVIFNPRMLGP